LGERALGEAGRGGVGELAGWCGGGGAGCTAGARERLDARLPGDRHGRLPRGGGRQEGGRQGFPPDVWVVRQTFPSLMRSTLAEIYRCRTCSCQEIFRVETPGQGERGHLAVVGLHAVGGRRCAADVAAQASVGSGRAAAAVPAAGGIRSATAAHPRCPGPGVPGAGARAAAAAAAGSLGRAPLTSQGGSGRWRRRRGGGVAHAPRRPRLGHHGACAGRPSAVHTGMAIAVRVEIMGSPQCRIVGKS
jgi:hypothetical protein